MLTDSEDQSGSRSCVHRTAINDEVYSISRGKVVYEGNNVSSATEMICGKWIRTTEERILYQSSKFRFSFLQHIKLSFGYFYSDLKT